MRSTAQDRDGLVKFVGRFNSTSVLSVDRIPFTLQRVAVGQYTIRFDPSLFPISANANTDYGPCAVYGQANGVFSVNTTNTVGTLTDVSNCVFSVTARKLGT